MRKRTAEPNKMTLSDVAKQVGLCRQTLSKYAKSRWFPRQRRGESSELYTARIKSELLARGIIRQPTTPNDPELTPEQEAIIKNCRLRIARALASQAESRATLMAIRDGLESGQLLRADDVCEQLKDALGEVVSGVIEAAKGDPAGFSSRLNSALSGFAKFPYLKPAMAKRLQELDAPNPANPEQIRDFLTPLPRKPSVPVATSIVDAPQTPLLPQVNDE